MPDWALPAGIVGVIGFVGGLLAGYIIWNVPPPGRHKPPSL